MIDTDQLSTYYQGKNMALFDQQAHVLTSMLMTVVESIHTTFPTVAQAGVFNTLSAIDHPSV